MSRIIDRTFILTLLVLTAFANGGCKKKQPELILEGKVRSSHTGSALSGVAILLEQKLVEGQVFSGGFNTAGSTNSGSDGMYEITWERQNIAELQVTAEKSNYISTTIGLNPDDFNAQEAVVKNISLQPEAFVQTRLVNIEPGEVSDQIRFRFNTEGYNCNCCENTWREITGADSDSTFTCTLYGNTWIRYRVEINTSESNILILDSIWCPAFQTTPLLIEY